MKKLILSITFLFLFSVTLFALENGRYYWCKDGFLNITATYDINGNEVKVDYHDGGICWTCPDSYGSYVITAGIRRDLPVNENIIKFFIQRNAASLSQQ